MHIISMATTQLHLTIEVTHTHLYIWFNMTLIINNRVYLVFLTETASNISLTADPQLLGLH
jgi:hypothetical protein